MTLTTAINDYVALRRSLGAVFSGQQSILRSFARTIGDVPLEEISSHACATFCRGTGAATRFWENKRQALCGFFRYLHSRNHLAESPLQEPGPRADRSFRPYIDSHQELHVAKHHGSYRVSAGAIPVAEGDVFLGKRYDSADGDGNAVGVAGQILEHTRR